MKIAVISDIHSNLHALKAALTAIDERGADAIYCLGDIVGYGADAAACVDLVRERCAGSVRGNHDEAVALERGLDVIPRDAREAAIHNRRQLKSDQIDYLSNLPLTLEAEGLTFVHASPQEPQSWLRLNSFTVVKDQFSHFDTDICFVGHTHIAGVVSNRVGVLSVRPGHRYLVNAGSVGQPRDDDPRLSFAFFDTEAVTCEIVRLGYDVEGAANRIQEAGLPSSLGKRLYHGR